VTLNPPCVPDHVLLKCHTNLPIPSVAAAKAYLQFDQIQGKRGIWFCGAYQGNLFHEDVHFILWILFWCNLHVDVR
jgi:cyclopropane-fatty-acyl-phospholipid synthase